MASTITNFAHLKIPLEDVLKATYNFSDKNIIGKGGFGNVYKGKLNRNGELIKIAARRLDRKGGQGDVEFWKEISVLSGLNHTYIVSMIGFCDEKGEKIIINRHYPKGSLSMHLRDPALTWSDRWRICYGVSGAIGYLHEKMEKSQYVIHRNINSSTILLDDCWDPKLSGFEFSIKQSVDLKNKVFLCDPIGTQGYIDPAIEKNGGVTHKSDIYSLGVILFEIWCGRKANEDGTLLAPLARFHYDKETLKNIVHHDLWNDHLMDARSFLAIAEIAYHCLDEDEKQRPDAFKVRNNLLCAQLRSFPKRKEVQYEDGANDSWEEKDKDGGENEEKENSKDTFRMSFQVIKIATQNFSDEIGGGGFGRVYKGEMADKQDNGHYTIVAKKLDTSHGQGEKQFYTELEILDVYKHKNIIGLVGYSKETDEKIIVYEYAARGSLDKCLKYASLTWRNRLKICIDVATALAFLHRGVGGQVVIHRDIKAANILLFEDWNAKLGDFGLSLISAIDKETDYFIDHPCGTEDYVDPMYLKSGFLTLGYDIYSFGVVLFEILCARPVYRITKDKSVSLLNFIKQKFEEGKQDEMVFKAIKEEIVPKCLTTFLNIVYQCLDDDREKRPISKEVLAQLKKALKFQDLNENVDKDEDDEEHEDEDLADWERALRDARIALQDQKSTLMGGRAGSDTYGY